MEVDGFAGVVTLRCEPGERLFERWVLGVGVEAVDQPILQADRQPERSLIRRMRSLVHGDPSRNLESVLPERTFALYPVG